MPKEEDKGKIRVFLFELEGTNETLLESVRSITGALKGTFTPTTKIVRLLAKPDQPSQPSVDDALVEVIEELDEGDSVSPEESDFKPRPAKVKKPRKIYTPNVIELDLSLGTTPFRKFAEAKNPGKHVDKYLVIAAWLKEFLGIDEIKADHIYTCYKFMKWNSPKDVGLTLRATPTYFGKGSADGVYVINHLGLDRVNEMNKAA
jgi:hypothetical protein